MKLLILKGLPKYNFDMNHYRRYDKKILVSVYGNELQNMMVKLLHTMTKLTD